MRREGRDRGREGEREGRDRGREGSKRGGKGSERGGTRGRGCTEESEGGGGTISTFIKVQIQNAYHFTLHSTGRCVGERGCKLPPFVRMWLSIAASAYFSTCTASQHSQITYQLHIL